jgi:hypothetical protein
MDRVRHNRKPAHPPQPSSNVQIQPCPSLTAVFSALAKWPRICSFHNNFKLFPCRSYEKSRPKPFAMCSYKMGEGGGHALRSLVHSRRSSDIDLQKQTNGTSGRILINAKSPPAIHFLSLSCKTHDLKCPQITFLRKKRQGVPSEAWLTRQGATTLAIIGKGPLVRSSRIRCPGDQSPPGHTARRELSASARSKLHSGRQPHLEG